MITAQELLDLIDKDTILSIMEDLGASCSGSGETSDGTLYLKFPTICHNGDSPDRLWWYENTGKFQCWTCCGSLSLYDLIIKVKSVSFKESFYYVADKVGVSIKTQDRYGFQDSDSIKRIKTEINDIEYLVNSKKHKYSIQEIKKKYDSKVLNNFDPNTFYQGWINEGITEETMRKFNIRFYWLEGHIIIPHYNINGDLIGIRRRSLNPEDAKNKYMPEFFHGVSYGHPLGLNLYGLYENQESIKKKKTAIIFEGEKSVMLSDSYYGKDSIAVATCGFNISDWQVKALKQLKVNNVYIGFDKDFDVTREYEYQQDNIIWENYSNYKNRLLTLGQRLAIYFNTYILYDKRDLLKLKDSPVDRGKQNFEKILKDAVLVR